MSSDRVIEAGVVLDPQEVIVFERKFLMTDLGKTSQLYSASVTDAFVHNAETLVQTRISSSTGESS